MEYTRRPHDHFIGIGNMVDDDRLSGGSVDLCSQMAYTDTNICIQKQMQAGDCRPDLRPAQKGPSMLAICNDTYCTTPVSRYTIPTSARAFGFDRQAVRL